MKTSPFSAVTHTCADIYLCIFINKVFFLLFFQNDHRIVMFTLTKNEFILVKRKGEMKYASGSFFDLPAFLISATPL